MRQAPQDKQQPPEAVLDDEMTSGRLSFESLLRSTRLSACDVCAFQFIAFVSFVRGTGERGSSSCLAAMSLTARFAHLRTIEPLTRRGPHPPEHASVEWLHATTRCFGGFFP